MKKFTKQLFLILLIVTSSLIMIGCEEGELPCSVEVTKADFPSYDFESALILYPDDIDNMSGPIQAATLTGGFSNTKEDMYWLAKYLRDVGNLIVIAVSASNNTKISSYENAHKAGIDILSDLDTDPRFPLFGKIGDIALIGYSMGGAGALQAAHDEGNNIGAAIGLAPYNTDNNNIYGISVPTMMLVGSIDATSLPSKVHCTFESLPNVPRSYGEIKGKGHLYWVNNNDETIASPYILAWIKYFMEGDKSYYGVPPGISSFEFIP